jgi:hypothetical protein
MARMAVAAEPAAVPTLSRSHPQTIRAAWWALQALRRVRAELERSGIDAAAATPTPPAIPGEAVRGVYAVLRRRRATCLERSLVMQAWLAAHGDARALIIGVTPPGENFHAHAWLEGEYPCHPGEFTELTRRGAPAG